MEGCNDLFHGTVERLRRTRDFRVTLSTAEILITSVKYNFAGTISCLLKGLEIN